MTNLTAEQNYITRLSKDNCPLYKNIITKVNVSEELDKARLYYFNQYKTNLESLTNISNMDPDTFDNSCEYIFFSQYDPLLELKFNPGIKDKAYCGAYLNGWIYKMCLALDIEWQLVSYEFLQ